MKGNSFFVALPFAIATLVVGLLAINPYPLGVLHDDAVYAILAKSLATGHGYRYLNLPGEPPATHFPPGYPLFLAALWRMSPGFPGNVVLFKMANAMWLVVGFGALVGLLRAQFRMSTLAAAALAFAVTAGVPMLFVSTLVLSETLFFGVAAVALLAVERVVARGTRPSDPLPIVAGLLCGAAALVRTPGIALLGGAVIHLAWHRRFREIATLCTASALLLIPWQVWTLEYGTAVPEPLRGAYGSYAGWLGDAVRQSGWTLVAKTIAVTSRQALDAVLAILSPSRGATIGLLTMLIVAALVVVGLRAMSRVSLVLPAFLAFYVVLILIWPSPPARYVWGIWPIAILVPVLGVRALLDVRGVSLRARSARFALCVLAIIPALGYARFNIEGFRTRAWLRIPAQGGGMLRPLVTGIRDHTEPTAVVASTAEAAVYLFTGRKTVPVYSFTADELFHGPTLDEQAAALSRIIAAYPVDAVVGSTPMHHLALQRIGTARRAAFVPVDSFPGSIIYARASRDVEVVPRE